MEAIFFFSNTGGGDLILGLLGRGVLAMDADFRSLAEKINVKKIQTCKHSVSLNNFPDGSQEQCQNTHKDKIVGKMRSSSP